MNFYAHKIYKLFLATVFSLTAITTVFGGKAVDGQYKIDPAHSTVLFTVSHLGYSDLTGRFDKFEGSFQLNAKGNSQVVFSVDTASVDTNHAKRDTHLRGPDFFNAKQFPQIRFVSSKVDYDASGLPVKVTGKLNLHGVSKAVTFTVKAVGAGKDPWGGYRAGYNAHAVIKRSEFGMNYMPGGIGNKVTITLNIEAIRQK